MTSRAHSDLLLVGSLPAESTAAAFRAGAELFGAIVFALPDGETGPRAAWVGYEREQLCRPHPDVVVVQETDKAAGWNDYWYVAVKPVRGRLRRRRR